MIEISQNPVLVIDSLMVDNSGQYSCVADNGVTHENAILTQTIIVNLLSGKTN